MLSLVGCQWHLTPNLTCVGPTNVCSNPLTQHTSCLWLEDGPKFTPTGVIISTGAKPDWSNTSRCISFRFTWNWVHYKSGVKRYEQLWSSKSVKSGTQLLSAPHNDGSKRSFSALADQITDKPPKYANNLQLQYCQMNHKKYRFVIEHPYHEPHGSLLLAILAQGHSSNTANVTGNHHTSLPVNRTAKDRNHQQICIKLTALEKYCMKIQHCQRVAERSELPTR